jgi:hypothetical protein
LGGLCGKATGVGLRPYYASARSRSLICIKGPEPLLIFLLVVPCCTARGHLALKTAVLLTLSFRERGLLLTSQLPMGDLGTVSPAVSGTPI